MNNDLYNSPSSNAAETASNSSTGLGIDFLDFGLDLSTILYWLNVTIFAWTIFYSIIFVVEFFFYRVKYSEGEFVERDAKGVQAIFQATGLWWGYLFCVILYFTYTIQPEGLLKSSIGWIAIISYILKILVADMPIIPVIGKYLGKPGQIIQDFMENIASHSLKLLTALVDGVVSIFNSPT